MIGVFGGSGFYSFLDSVEQVDVQTEYGKPSSPITIGEVGSKKVAFIARHGLKHEIPPHRTPYKANIAAFKELGITRIIAPSAVGSLRKEIMPGSFVVPDQFVSFTQREDTFYNGPETTHISSADPYCPELRSLLTNEGKNHGLDIHDKGIVVVINGPRFASRAESNMYRSMGFDIINMTQYPENMLARELEMCYANISIVTDYDTGVKDDPSVKPVSLEEVIRAFNENNEKIKLLLKDLIPKIPESQSCGCKNALEGARF